MSARAGPSPWPPGATRRAATARCSAPGPSSASSTPAADPRLGAADGERLVDAMARAGFDAARGAQGQVRPEDPGRLRGAAHRAGTAPRRRAHPDRPRRGHRRHPARRRSPSSARPTTRARRPMAWRKDAFLGRRRVRAQAAREHMVKRGSGRSVTNFGRIEIAPRHVEYRPRPRHLLHEMRELDGRTLARLDRRVPRPGARDGQAARASLKVEPISQSRARARSRRVMKAVAARLRGARAQVQAHALRRGPRRPEPGLGHRRPACSSSRPAAGAATVPTRPATGRPSSAAGTCSSIRSCSSPADAGTRPPTTLDGVTVSYFEWVQNVQQFTWEEDRVNAELHRHLREAYATIARVAREHRVPFRTAAFIVAIGRVGRATVLRGV